MLNDDRVNPHSDAAAGEMKEGCSTLWREDVRSAHLRQSIENVDARWLDWWEKRFDRLMRETILPRIDVARSLIIAEEAARVVEAEVLTCENEAKRDAGVYVYERFPFRAKMGHVARQLDEIYQEIPFSSQ